MAHTQQERQARRRTHAQALCRTTYGLKVLGNERGSKGLIHVSRNTPLKVYLFATYVNWDTMVHFGYLIISSIYLLI